MLHTECEDANHHQPWWNMFKPVFDVLVSCCTCSPFLLFSLYSPPAAVATVMGTIICPTNHGRVKIAMQNHAETFPLVTLELPLHTPHFATLVRSETNRIVFTCPHGGLGRPLLSAPVWAMLCNGKKMGFAVSRAGPHEDASLMEMIRSVTTGAGLLPDKAGFGEHRYLRGQFVWTVGSSDSEACHLVDPSGCFGQELSLLFLRN
ncbi:protein MIZU-KUSSEI 1-like [Rhodamnia argentea]|uniref:Protein MIZU-KUSSEI 1-like n=1 Tax=Rhodamnia argentea TaxID=178133 RepID=A0A8B8QXQ0_9MYRT|nr:protein MIZU-KUSSEI 1-like [Rhodamnia argentea]